MRRMKRIAALVCAAATACQVAGCSGASGSTGAADDEKAPSASFADASEGVLTHQSAGLRMLTEGTAPALTSHCINENGFYYITQDAAPMRDNSYARHLMYMDFASQQEVYLCSAPGCLHDTAACTSVLCADEFPEASQVFLFQDMLYVLSREYDRDGSGGVDMSIDGTGLRDTAPAAAALYRMNPDGTGRTRVYEFEAGLTVEDMVLGEGTDLYFTVKKLSAEAVNGGSYTTSSERRLVRLDTQSWKCETAYCFERAETDTDWQVIGCFDNCLVLSAFSFDHALSDEERFSDDALKDSYARARTRIGVLNLADGTVNTVQEFQNEYSGSFSYRQEGEILYMSEKNALRYVNLSTGEERVLAELENSQIWGVYDDVVCCRSWNLTDDYTLYFVSKNDGNITHCGITNYTLGWELELCGETSDKFLVIYDYDAVPRGEDAYDITQYRYALIAKEDLYNGTANLLPIQMISKGV